MELGRYGVRVAVPVEVLPVFGSPWAGTSGGVDPIPLFGPPEGGVFRLLHDDGLVALSGLINEIGTLWPIAPCGRTSL